MAKRNENYEARKKMLAERRQKQLAWGKGSNSRPVGKYIPAGKYRNVPLGNR